MNEVNAPRAAQNLGLNVTESRHAEGSDFTDLITLEATKGEKKFTKSARPLSACVRASSGSMDTISRRLPKACS